MTKEEILWSFPQGESEPYGRVPVNRIYEAMDQYYNQAIDEAIAAVQRFYTEASSICPETLPPYLEALKKKP